MSFQQQAICNMFYNFWFMVSGNSENFISIVILINMFRIFYSISVSLICHNIIFP